MIITKRFRRSLLYLIISIILLSMAGASAAAQTGPFPRAPRGQEAVDALGDRLPEVAQAYGLTSQQLVNLFLQDPTLSVDQNGELYYIDVFPGEAFSANSGPQYGPYPYSETFLLESLPGADKTIYLDFDGHVTTGTTWNSAYGVSTINSPAYSIDGDGSTFNNQEMDRIQYVWEIVSEDFAPFNINVTTKDPGPAALSRSVC